MHATDYKSRPRVKHDKMEVMRAQVVQAIKNCLADKWSKKAIEEYCLMAYKDMGLTKGLYEVIAKQYGLYDTKHFFQKVCSCGAIVMTREITRKHFEATCDNSGLETYYQDADCYLRLTTKCSNCI